MDIQKLRVFLTVADSGSFSKAADKLSYSPAGIQYVVNTLEDELGIKLIERNYNGIRLNESGALLLPEIRRVVSAYDSFESVVHSCKDSSEQILHIASIDTVATKWLPEATVMFQNMFPDVHIDMITGDPFEINDWIKDGTADIGLTEKTWASGDYTFTELFRDPFFGVFPPTETISGPCPLSAFENSDFFIPDFRRDRNIPILLRENGVKVNFISDNASTPSIVRSIAAGRGVSILSLLYLDLCSIDPYASVPGKGIPAIYPLDPPAERILGAVHMPERNSTPFRKFIQCLKKVIKESD